MKKMILVRAHELAKTMEGDYTARMSLALAQAWAEARKPVKATLVTSSGSRKHKSWVARIDGTDARYGLKRTFIDAVDSNWTEKHFELGAGIYEVCDAGERKFIRVTADQIETIGKGEVTEVVA